MAAQVVAKAFERQLHDFPHNVVSVESSFWVIAFRGRQAHTI